MQGEERENVIKDLASAFRTTNRYDVALEKDEYQRLIFGLQGFVIVKLEGHKAGDLVCFHEYDNLRETGNVMLKNISYVCSNHPGLKEGYGVISWN